MRVCYLPWFAVSMILWICLLFFLHGLISVSNHFITVTRPSQLFDVGDYFAYPSFQLHPKSQLTLGGLNCRLSNHTYVRDINTCFFSKLMSAFFILSSIGFCLAVIDLFHFRYILSCWVWYQTSFDVNWRGS